MANEVMHEHLTALHNRYGADTVFISELEAARYCRVDARTLQKDKTFPSRTIGTKGKHRHVSLINFAHWLSLQT